MDIELSVNEARIIGCLLEKEITTPDQYPLSLNALTNACNQKTNREPVLNFDEASVQKTLDQLIKKHLVSEKSGFGSRVLKFQHRFCNSEFGLLKFSPQQLAIVCVLLLRGPQTPGELRTRCERLAKFTDVHQVESALGELRTREDGPFVVCLPREAGKRESRFAHLFSGEMEVPTAEAEETDPATLLTSDHQRLDRLELLVQALRDEVDDLKKQLGG